MSTLNGEIEHALIGGLTYNTSKSRQNPSRRRLGRFGLSHVWQTKLTASPPSALVGSSDHGLQKAPGTKPKLRLATRHITKADFPNVAALLHEGFSHRLPAYFLNVLAVLSERPRLTNTPLCGFILEANGEPVGVLLSIAACVTDTQDALPRLNVSCWYVRPDYRVYGHALAARLGAQSCSSILNTSPASYTLRTIEAQGFRRFTDGMFAGIPLLAVGSRSTKIVNIGRLSGKPQAITDLEWRILQDHQRFGCTSWVGFAGDDAFPFVFRRRRAKWLPLNGAQLIYCRDISAVSQFAWGLGVALASRLMFWMLVSENTGLKGVPGFYIANRSPMYSKGEVAMRTGDLAYSEMAIFGL